MQLNCATFPKMSGANDIRTMFARARDRNTKREQLREMLAANKFRDATILADALGEPIPTGVIVRIDRAKATT
jgi:maleate cis-trans isomerase